MSTIITAQMVNELRGATGAGLLDCKKALTEANGSVADATTILRKKLGSKLDKLSSRTTKEGLIESYIHLGGKVGVLIEINCETDFVARNDDFKSFVRDLCLQIAAANPLYVSRDQVPEADLAKEREIASAGCGAKNRRGKTGEFLFDHLPARSAVRKTKRQIHQGALDRPNRQDGREHRCAAFYALSARRLSSLRFYMSRSLPGAAFFWPIRTESADGSLTACARRHVGDCNLGKSKQ